MKRKVWEHTVEIVTGLPNTHKNFVRTMGHQGWELITVMPFMVTSAVATLPSYALYFKREGLQNVGVQNQERGRSQG